MPSRFKHLVLMATAGVFICGNFCGVGFAARPAVKSAVDKPAPITHWQARWISAPLPRNNPLWQLQWMWGGGGGGGTVASRAYFRKHIDLPGGVLIKKAAFDLTDDEQFKLYVNGVKAGHNTFWRGANWNHIYHPSVAHLLHPGGNILAIAASNIGDNFNAAGLIGNLTITLASGRQIHVPIDSSWQATNSIAQPGWTRLHFPMTGWKPAHTIALWGHGPWGHRPNPRHTLPLFRRDFVLTKPVAQADIYVSGLGQYDLFINGRKVGDDVLQPGWTDYQKRVLYNSYNCTSLLRQGRNAIGVMLGTGMYDCPEGTHRYEHAPNPFGRPKLILQLHVTFTDNTSETIVSNSRWQTAPGPVTFSSIYGGEDYNALDAIPGWDTARFNASHWQHAVETHGSGGVLTAQIAPPVKVMHTYKAICITHPQPGVLVYDLGQNMAGRPVITARGPAGSTFTVYPSELLHPNGTQWQSCAEPIWCTYTLNGKGVEIFHPMFSYFGFRYVQIDGATTNTGDPGNKPVILKVVGQATHTSAPTIGHFACSNKLLNKIHHLITMAMVNNMVSIITDCPTREKTGWLEDTYLVGPGIMDNYFVPGLYAQTAANMRDAQHHDGMVPDFAPAYFKYAGGFINSPEWGSASVIDPWLIYRYFGDRQILAQNYQMMVRYVHYLKSRAKGNIVAYGLGDWFDLGPSAPGMEQLTSMGVTATATWYRDLTIMVKISKLLGHPNASRHYSARAATVRAAFNRKFYHSATGEYDRGSQCANAMALATGLVQKDNRQKVLANLIANIHKHGDHTTAGDIGFHYVVQALTNAGQSALLYKMATQTNSPSYGYQIAHGATALTEAWDALPQDSQDHFMLGHIEQWFFNGLGGIHLDMARKPGRQLEIRPAIVENLKWVKVSYDSVLGNIVSHWHHVGRHLTMHIVIPPNVTARVYIPTHDATMVQLNGKSISTALAACGGKIIQPAMVLPGVVVCQLPSGDYRIGAAY